MRCRFDSRATNTMLDRTEQEQQRGALDSGISLDRTTLVLGRSASWKVAAGRAAAEGEDAAGAAAASRCNRAARLCWHRDQAAGLAANG